MPYQLTGNSGSYVHTDTTQWPSMPAAITIMARFNVASLGTNVEKCFIVRDRATGEDFWAYMLSSHEMSLWTPSSDATDSNTTVTTGEQAWTVVHAYNWPTQSTMTLLYLDDAFREQNVSYEGSYTTLKIGIGANSDGTYGNMNAAIRDVRIWSGTLTAEEVGIEYLSGSPVKTNTLLAWYPLVSNAADASGNGAPNLLVSGGSFIGSATVAAVAANAAASTGTPTVGVAGSPGDVALIDAGTQGNVAFEAVSSSDATVNAVAAGCAASSGTPTLSVDWTVTVTAPAAATATAPVPVVRTSGDALVFAVPAYAAATAVIPIQVGAPTAGAGDILLQNSGAGGDIRVGASGGSSSATVFAIPAIATASAGAHAVWVTSESDALVFAKPCVAAATGVAPSGITADVYVFYILPSTSEFAGASAYAPIRVGEPGRTLAAIATASTSAPHPTIYGQTSSLGNILMKNPGIPGNIDFVGSSSVSSLVAAVAATATATTTPPQVSGEAGELAGGDIVLRDDGVAGNIALAPLTGAQTVAAVAATAAASTGTPTIKADYKIIAKAAVATAQAVVPTIQTESTIHANVAAKVAVAAATAGRPVIANLSSLVFPDILGQTYGRLPIYNVIRSPLEFANDQRRRLTTEENLFRYSLGWDALTAEQVRQIQSAVTFAYGPWGTFYFFEWEPLEHVNLSCGAGDGQTKVFNIPGKDVTGTSFKVGGSPTAGTVTHNAGSNGEDTVTFVAAPGNGVAVTASFTGRVRRTVSMSAPFGVEATGSGATWALSMALEQEDLS